MSMWHRHDEEHNQNGSSPSQTRIGSETNRGEVAGTAPEGKKGGVYCLETEPSKETAPSLDSVEKISESLPSEMKTIASPTIIHFRNPLTAEDNATPSIRRSVPHQGESLTLPPDDPYAHANHHPSPPPIATLSQSPSLSVSSLDRSSVSTPNPLKPPSPRDSLASSPMYTPYPTPHFQSSRALYHNDYSSRPVSNTHQSYSYTSPPVFEHRYQQSPSLHPMHHMTPTYPVPHLNLPNLPPASVNVRSTFSTSPYPPLGQSAPSPMYTDDAATKLSDRVRRRCFNCCTTDTSTWRRSNLSPGKVLCNKCGLFERTHARPRPDQFPHKRGPLATSSLRRSPQPQPQTPTHQRSVSNHGSLPSAVQYHPITPPSMFMESRKEYTPNALPDIQSWINESNSMPTPTTKRNAERLSNARPRTPLLPQAPVNAVDPPCEDGRGSSSA